MIISYEEAVTEFGSPYRIQKEVESGRLFRVARGFYSNQRHVDPYVLCALRYPGAIVTADSAFYLHGLTDVVPEKVHLATLRSATRISSVDVVQHFSKKRFYSAGEKIVVREGVQIRVYGRERMLVELMRSASSMPLDYYVELIRSYRKITDELDIRAIEDYIALFDRNVYMFDILQKEVL